MSLRSLGLLVTGIVLLSACSPSQDNDEASSSFILAGGSTTVSNRTSGAFSQPASNLNETEFALHAAGDSLFESPFVNPPSSINPGLGPRFNNNSCRSCHIGNGRGMPILGKSGSSNSPMLVRVSVDPSLLDQVPGSSGTQFPGDGPFPVPGLGIQLQDQAVFGQIPEVVVRLHWDEITGQFPDGTAYSLRKPRLTFEGQAQNVALMNNAAVLHSLRQTPPVVGLGLLEAIAEETLLAMEDPADKNGDGISGHLNRVWDPVHGKVAIGRFGWKASAPSLEVQAAAAFSEDMGVHNFLFTDTDGSVEITPEQVRSAAYYTQTLGVPDRVRSNIADSQTGERIFSSAGCASCHIPQLTTDDKHPIAALRNQSFAAYTDLLLHDMGEGLADYRQDYQASGTEWRTAPLWGVGVAGTILQGSAFMHDGRARTLEEAILWHGGEAAKSQERYLAMPKEYREKLLAFLRSL